MFIMCDAYWSKWDFLFAAVVNSDEPMVLCLFCVAETDMEDKGCGEMHSQGEK